MVVAPHKWTMLYSYQQQIKDGWFDKARHKAYNKLVTTIMLCVYHTKSAILMGGNIWNKKNLKNYAQEQQNHVHIYDTWCIYIIDHCQ